MKVASSSGMFKTEYHNGTNKLLFRKKITKF